METCKVFEFKIADNEKDGEDPANQVLVGVIFSILLQDLDQEQMFRFD